MTTRHRLLDRGLFGILTWLRNRSVLRASKTVVLGNKMLEHMIAQLGDRPDADGKFAVIANWTDTEAIEPVAAADNPLRAEWHLDQHFVVGYSGNMGIAHDFDVVLAAALKLLDQPEVQVSVYR